MSDIVFSNFKLKPSLFDHPTEQGFYNILRDEILGKQFIAIPQIPYPALIKIPLSRKNGFQSYWNRIQARRLDFLLCDREDLTPRLAIELDGSSHNSKKAKKTDEFKDKLFKEIGLPLLRVEVREEYNRELITLQIADKLGMKRK